MHSNMNTFKWLSCFLISGKNDKDISKKILKEKNIYELKF